MGGVVPKEYVAAAGKGIEEAMKSGPLAGFPVVDIAIKAVDGSSLVQCTHDREFLRAVQTPQGFALGPLRAAHSRATVEGWDVTDDASLMERCSEPVLVVEGEEGPMNRKVAIAAVKRLGDRESRTDQDLVAVESPLTLTVTHPSIADARPLGVRPSNPA